MGNKSHVCFACGKNKNVFERYVGYTDTIMHMCDKCYNEDVELIDRWIGYRFEGKELLK